MNKKEFKAIELQISKFHSRLYHALNNKTWVNPITRIDEMEKKDEKQHRQDRRVQFGLSSAYKLFTVQHIFEGLNSDLEVNDILHIRLACYYGQAIANEYRKEIEAEFTQEEIQEFLKIDYAEMMEGYE